MKACLIPLKIELRNPPANLRHFQDRLAQVARHQPDLVCLPECAFTGYLYDEEDFARFAEPIPGKTTALLSRLASKYHCSICFGMLERTEEGVYSTAVLIDQSGHILLTQRKMSEKPPFLAGEEVKGVNTEFGRLAFLLCGDLFLEDIKARLPDGVDIVIAPLARSFAGKSPDLERWLNEERQVYADQVKKIGVLTCLVNALEDPSLPDASFGGAMVVSPQGDILAESMHGTDETVIFEWDPG